MGISVFANAIDEMKTIDLIYDSYRNEFSLGKKRIFVKSGALNVNLESGDAVPVFDENDVEFYALPDEDGTEMIKESKFDIRAEQHKLKQLQKLLAITQRCLGIFKSTKLY